MKHVKAVVKLVVETCLIPTVGSLFWILLGQEVVNTYESGEGISLL